MLKVQISWRAWTIGIVAAALTVWIVESSQSFQSCTKGAQYQGGEYTLQKRIADLSTLLDRRRTCLGIFVHDNEGAITALATLFIALFTLTLWRSSEKMWGVTKISADAAQKSAEVAEGTLSATNRPWASIAKMKVAGPLVFQNGEGHVPLSFALKNLGHSPAIRVSINVKLVLSNITNLLETQKEFCDNFRKPLPPNAIQPELTLWPGDFFVFTVSAWMNSMDMPKFKEWADRTPFPIALLAVIGCIDYEFTFGEGEHHQTALIYDLHKISPYPRSQFGSVYSHIPGALLLEGTIPESDLILKLNIVGTGPID